VSHFELSLYVIIFLVSCALLLTQPLPLPGQLVLVALGLLALLHAIVGQEQ
jgi:membrane protein DedA with SNARE-associated domain